MIRRHWNELRVGDHVLVHDDVDSRLPLAPGRVIEIEPAPGTNDITIRITPTRGAVRIVRPSRLTVHAEELDPDRHCWRCDTHARTGET